MNYPTLLPLGDLQEIVRILKAGSFAAERTALAKHIWLLQGYAQYATLGEPDGVAPQALVAQLPNFQVGSTLPELTEKLEDILLTKQREADSDTVVAQSLTIPVAWLLQLILPKLMDLLFEYLKTKI